ncbi:MAG: hypothetical protein KF888_08090 [Nitrosomonas sp.]|nr:hypothetical protein [Nitrosomonas sp.]
MKIFNIKITLLLLVVLISGCAGTGGSYKLKESPLSNEQAAKYSELSVKIQPGENINLNQESIDRITQLIIGNIQSDHSNRFAKINHESLGDTTIEAAVIIKRYEEGSVFARMMLAGLGQMHIDADVILYDHASRERLTQYEVNKTFAWGGIYGGMTTIKDVEVGFSKAVADAILGKK